MTSQELFTIQMENKNKVRASKEIESAGTAMFLEGDGVIIGVRYCDDGYL